MLCVASTSLNCSVLQFPVFIQEEEFRLSPVQEGRMVAANRVESQLKVAHAHFPPPSKALCVLSQFLAFGLASSCSVSSISRIGLKCHE